VVGSEEEVREPAEQQLHPINGMEVQDQPNNTGQQLVTGMLPLPLGSKTSSNVSITTGSEFSRPEPLGINDIN